jgi:hypothetical protein
MIRQRTLVEIRPFQPTLLWQHCTRQCCWRPLVEKKPDADCCPKLPQYSSTHTGPNNRQRQTAKKKEKENAFLLCRCHFNQRTVLPTRGWQLNRLYHGQCDVRMYNPKSARKAWEKPQQNMKQGNISISVQGAEFLGSMIVWFVVGLPASVGHGTVSDTELPVSWTLSSPMAARLLKRQM